MACTTPPATSASISTGSNRPRRGPRPVWPPRSGDGRIVAAVRQPRCRSGEHPALVDHHGAASPDAGRRLLGDLSTGVHSRRRRRRLRPLVTAAGAGRGGDALLSAGQRVRSSSASRGSASSPSAFRCSAQKRRSIAPTYDTTVRPSTRTSRRTRPASPIGRRPCPNDVPSFSSCICAIPRSRRRRPSPHRSPARHRRDPLEESDHPRMPPSSSRWQSCQQVHRNTGAVSGLVPIVPRTPALAM